MISEIGNLIDMSSVQLSLEKLLAMKVLQLVQILVARNLLMLWKTLFKASLKQRTNFHQVQYLIEFEYQSNHRVENIRP